MHIQAAMPHLDSRGVLGHLSLDLKLGQKEELYQVKKLLTSSKDQAEDTEEMETIIMFQTTAILYIIALEVPFSVAFLIAENFLKVSMIFGLIFSYPTVCTDVPETNFILGYVLPRVKLKCIESFQIFIAILQPVNFWGFFCKITFNDNSLMKGCIHRGNVHPVLEEKTVE